MFSYAFDLCSRVDDKKFFTPPISGIKNLSKKSKLFEFWQDANKKELKKITTFLCYSFVIMVFVSTVHIRLQTKLPSTLTASYVGKYRPVVQDY